MNRRALLIAATAAGIAFAAYPGLAAGPTPYEAGSFQSAVAAGPVVVHVFADWCPVCKAQQPTLASLSGDAKLAKVRFITVNFDKDKDFLRANKVANQSVILVFKGGKEVVRLSGTTDAAKIREGVMRAL